jgi:hypothetical protein
LVCLYDALFVLNSNESVLDMEVKGSFFSALADGVRALFWILLIGMLCYQWFGSPSLVSKRLPEQKANELAALIMTGQFTHDFPITVEQAKSVGLPISTRVPESIDELMDFYPQRGTGPLGQLCAAAEGAAGSEFCPWCVMKNSNRNQNAVAWSFLTISNKLT